MSTRLQLLQRAAQCYHFAGWQEDACRCYEAVQDHTSAARLHEQAGRWLRAAECYGRANEWRRAARAYLQAGEPLEAGEALVRAGDPREAAWVFADQGRLFTRARSMADSLPASTAVERTEHHLLLARCEVGRNLADHAGVSLRRALRPLEELGPSFARRRPETWAVRVAELLARPDLLALIHALALRVGADGAAERWTQWASHTLGDATGIPAHAPPPPGAEAARVTGDLPGGHLAEPVKLLLRLAQEQGYVTQADLNEALPDGLSQEDLDGFRARLRGLGVEIVEAKEV